ncbi:MAG: short-subunit dehydrogenase [Bermanella sp.]|jgi:short-subunit dehydrogenase
MKNIWLVGASSGIGQSLAFAYAELGHRVFISARSVDALNAQALSYAETVLANKGFTGELVAVPLDVTDSTSICNAVNTIKDHVEFLDSVIINAGTCEYIDDVVMDIELFRRVMETNLFGAIQVSNASLPLLFNSPDPQLVFVSSSVTYQALPRAHAYGGSKVALRYFTECLKTDIQHHGVDVRLVSPGFVKTPLTDKNDFDMPFMITSDNAAQRIVHGLQGKKFDIHFPKRFTIPLKIFSFLPDRIKFKLLGKMTRVDNSQADETKS